MNDLKVNLFQCKSWSTVTSLLLDQKGCFQPKAKPVRMEKYQKIELFTFLCLRNFMKFLLRKWSNFDLKLSFL